MNEGLASAVLSERYHDLGPRHLHAWVKAHRPRIPPLAKLIDETSWNQVEQAVAYNASASFIAYLLESFGASPVKELYHASPTAFARRFREIFGQSLDEAEDRWVTGQAKCESATVGSEGGTPAPSKPSISLKGGGGPTCLTRPLSRLFG